MADLNATALAPIRHSPKNRVSIGDSFVLGTPDIATQITSLLDIDGLDVDLNTIRFKEIRGTVGGIINV